MLRRVFVIDVGEGILEFVNPEILETSGTQEGAEGCLSFPGEYGMVERPNHVKVRAQNRMGEWFELEGEELLARAICHENDHLDGVVFKDRMFRLLTEEELAD
jgi:peptide deformylase